MTHIPPPLHAIVPPCAQALDQAYTMPGAKMVLSVRWADPDLQERKRRAAEGLAEDQRQVGAGRAGRRAVSPGQACGWLGGIGLVSGRHCCPTTLPAPCTRRAAPCLWQPAAPLWPSASPLPAHAPSYPPISPCPAPTPRPKTPRSTRPPACPLPPQLFVAKILKSSPEEDVAALFSHYGTVDKVSMFKPQPDALYHKARRAGGRVGGGAAFGGGGLVGGKVVLRRSGVEGASSALVGWV